MYEKTLATYGEFRRPIPTEITHERKLCTSSAVSSGKAADDMLLIDQLGFSTKLNKFTNKPAEII